MKQGPSPEGAPAVEDGLSLSKAQSNTISLQRWHMIIKVLRNTIAGGKQLRAGKTADVSEQDAKTLIAMGKAEEKTGM